MTDIDDTRLHALVDAADHDSVTTELLAGGDRYSQLYLYDDPAVSYLEPTEQPHYAFFNEMKGIGIDDKRDTVTPASGGLAVIVITDERTLIVVAGEDGDRSFEVPHGDVTGVEYSCGLMKHRLAVRTDETTYHCWIDSSYEESALAAAAGAIERYRDRVQSERSSPDTRTGTSDSPAPISSDGGQDGGSPSPSDQSESGDSDSDDDPLETIERLAELNEAGAISDEEFAEKKRDLLDQI
jgi:hypothetical protein